MWWRSLPVLLALALAACQVRPLYYEGAAATGGGSPVAALAEIVVEEPRTRAEQLLRNELVFQFRGRGGSANAARYGLRTIVSTSTDNLAVELEEDLPAAVLLTMNATFILSDESSERTLLTGSSLGTASYDFSSQRFANVRAERDAMERAAKVVAQNIAARIAAYFAARGS